MYTLLFLCNLTGYVYSLPEIWKTLSIPPLQSIIYDLITTYPTKTTNKADTAYLTVLGFIPLVTC